MKESNSRETSKNKQSSDFAYKTSIASAPKEKKFPVLLAVSVGLAVSIIFNIVALFTIFANTETINLLKKDISDYKNEIIDLKNQINELDK